MYNYEYREDMPVGRICLELSLKPFKKLDTLYIESVCRKLFSQWKPLIKRSTGCAVMLWTSDGSEILAYSGDLSEEFEWCRYIGIGNPGKNPEKNGDIRNLHVKPVLYTPDPPAMHYSDLRNIVSAIKRIGLEETGFNIDVGETFDPGPEFAYSEFKYERHPEICQGNIMGAKQWLHCASVLHADSYKYAAYPDGIPEGTHFGEFLGRQFKKLKEDIGFDYLWLSNGFGFSLNSWNWTGQLFDGNSFDFSGAASVRDSINDFWKHFSAEMNGDIIEVRGSNLSTGMDISAHGCPIDDIYKNNITAPPNSPWAAMDYRFGLEFVGFMSHIAELPANGFTFRYYIHDPWWINSPWFDRYGRSPHDIYLPLAVTRMDAEGKVTPPRGINLLSADDSFGNLPDKCPNEVIPYILEACSDYPDSAGLLTWIYPFEYYCDIGLREGKMDRIIMDDWFIESAVDLGLPLNTVISDKNFASSDLSSYKNTVLLTAVPESGSKLEASVIRAVRAGCRIILYGDTSHASEELRTLLGLKVTSPISGLLKIDTYLSSDKSETDLFSDILYHDPVVSSGGICETADGSCELLAAVSSPEGIKRVYAVKKGNIIWIRGSFPHIRSGDRSLPGLTDRKENFNPSVLLRYSLAKFNMLILFDCYNVNDKLPLIFISRNKNAFYFSGFSKDATVKAHMSFTDGAPAINDTEFIIKNGIGTYPLSKFWHRECRVFIKQACRAKIITRTLTVADCMEDDRHIEISGLTDAAVTFYAPSDHKVLFRRDNAFFWLGSDVEYSSSGDDKYIAENFSGILHIGWQQNGTAEIYSALEIPEK